MCLVYYIADALGFWVSSQFTAMVAPTSLHVKLEAAAPVEVVETDPMKLASSLENSSLL